MADCDWLRSTFSGPLFSLNGKTLKKKRKRENTETIHAFRDRTAKLIENLEIII
jgi:hypothetical protein